MIIESIAGEPVRHVNGFQVSPVVNRRKNFTAPARAADHFDTTAPHSRNATMESRPGVVEIFAGAGLLSLAFRQVGYRLLRAIEIDRIAAATYRLNLGEHIEVADVTRSRPRGRCDVLLAGPPCQGFSTLGKRRADDPRNALSLEVVRWARSMKPSVVVVENVAAFVASDQHRTVVAGLVDLGFDVRVLLLDAFDYGAPQLRNRSFTIATRTGREVAVPRTNRRIKTVEEAWAGLSGEPDGRNWHYAPRPSLLAAARMRLIPEGGDKRDIVAKRPDLAPPSWLRLNCQATDAWGRMSWGSPSNTLRTALLNPSKGRYIHPEQHRVISLREAARLHTIPDSWKFEGLPTQIARQIGNSVPPALGRAVARSVLAVL